MFTTLGHFEILFILGDFQVSTNLDHFGLFTTSSVGIPCSFASVNQIEVFLEKIKILYLNITIMCLNLAILCNISYEECQSMFTNNIHITNMMNASY